MGAELTPPQREFFESKIRPVLVENCYECHNSIDSNEGGFIADFAGGMLQADSGPMIVKGKPEQSRLIKILRHEIDGLEMPEGGPKLADAVIKDFEDWVQMGLPDPRDQAPTEESLREQTSWENTLQRRKQWWSLQPIESAALPGGRSAAQVPTRELIDAWINQGIENAGVKPSPPADHATLIRRLYVVLTGLPPSIEQQSRWLGQLKRGQDQQAVVAALASELIDSPAFAERWARHWMDWIRYAESHGSEGDPRIENAWYYRDYLIRALNEDIPYDTMLREHIAGDLLTKPRINQQLGLNESTIATAHWRMVFHGFAPTDALDEKVRFIDDQINVFSKAFLGLTVSCARCHDHKFDAISQADYYALFGILSSCRPGRNVANVDQAINAQTSKLATLKKQIRQQVAAAWLRDIDAAGQRLFSRSIPEKADQAFQSAVPNQLSVLASDDDRKQPFAKRWQQRLERLKSDMDHALTVKQQAAHYWDFANVDDRQAWFVAGNGLEFDAQVDHPRDSFALRESGVEAIEQVMPAAVRSDRISRKHAGRFTSPDVQLADNQVLWVLAKGAGQASVRYVVQDYPRNGTVYPVQNLTPQWKWYRFDLAYWAGDSIHVEVTTAKDAPLLTKNDAKSWFAVRKVLITDRSAPGPRLGGQGIAALLNEDQATVKSLDELTVTAKAALQGAIESWGAGNASHPQSVMIADCVDHGVLSAHLDHSKSLRELVEKYRALEAQVLVPTRVPGIEETAGTDQAMMVRGNHKQLGELVPRRFLEAIDSTPYEAQDSGRLQLAEDLLRVDNPLTRRVIVNRLWHHLYGTGLVRTPDNFGRLGFAPSHPELLDALADRFSQQDWSIKQMVHAMVTTEAWQRSSSADELAFQKDPDNQLFARSNVRRMEAEVVRDALLSVSGSLAPQTFGPPVNADSNRRSLYVRVVRNALDPFLRVFDYPEPFSCVGARDVTNVPAQSLAMMNSPQVVKHARSLANRVLRDPALPTVESKINRMFRLCFARHATDDELLAARTMLDDFEFDFREQSARQAAIKEQRKKLEEQVQRLLATARQRWRESQTEPDQESQSLPEAYASWDFTKSLESPENPITLKLQRDARQDADGLHLGRDGYAISSPLTKPIEEKTLMVTVQLSDLNQRGGGAITLQTADGSLFDSIVFGEQTPKHWMAGSNLFHRTKPFGGAADLQAGQQPVHLAITYDNQGTITGYRNGQAYGKPYRTDKFIGFAAKQSVVTFGVRHLPASGGRLLHGRILNGALFDRVLGAEEIQAIASGNQNYVSEQQLVKLLSAEQRAQYEKSKQGMEEITKQLDQIGPVREASDAETMAALAHSMFQLKEFLYVR
ncbi:Planctomycete cytochrome C [Stieleria bergensis]|uniref:Planctomycete cytochrome C n=2 Tax=Stieleria bergensis TaxID=2528025 RepID=A0A517SUF1_9BACT|nr:Planctomycete cytochrome C [Planctomycetes bacterium SV_7m_r]